MVINNPILLEYIRRKTNLESARSTESSCKMRALPICVLLDFSVAMTMASHAIPAEFSNWLLDQTTALLLPRLPRALLLATLCSWFWHAAPWHWHAVAVNKNGATRRATLVVCWYPGGCHDLHKS